MSSSSTPQQRWTKTKKEFIDMTTLHGLRRAADQTGQISKLRQCIWAFFIAIGFGAIIVITFDQVSDYWKHPTTTKTTVTYTDDPLDFPSVTICSLNRFYNYSGNISSADREAMNAYDMAELSYTHDIPFKELEREYVKNIQKTMNSEQIYKFDTKYSNCDCTIIQEVAQKLSSVALQILLTIRCSNKCRKVSRVKTVFDKYGFNLTQFLVSCKFGDERRRQCSASDFTPIYSTRYGLCWTFNDKTSKRWRQMHSGIAGGLRLEIQNPQEMFIQRSVQMRPRGAGLKIILHEPHEPPDVDESGFFVGPGFHSFAQIDPTKEEHVSPPWGKCALKSQPFYTKNGAEHSCYRNLSMTSCGCIPATFKIQKSDEICSPTQYVECMYKVKWATDIDDKNLKESSSAFTKDWTKCRKPPACKSWKYKVSLSSVVWPSLRDLQYLQTSEKMKNKIRENNLVLDIYYPELKYQHIQEITLIYFTNLLSKFGGTLGLFLGASILTILELIELMLMYCRRNLETTHKNLRKWRSISDHDDINETLLSSTKPLNKE